MRFIGSAGLWEEVRLERTERFNWYSVQLPSVPSSFTLLDGAAHLGHILSPTYSLLAPGRYAVYRGALLPISPPTRRILLVADLDGTLIKLGDQEAAAASGRFVRHWLQTHYFNGSKLVYSTGRFLEEFESLTTMDVELLDPDLLISDMGSDAYSMSNDTGKYEVRTDYRAACPADHWDTDIVSQTIDAQFPWLIRPPTGQSARLRTWRFVRSTDLSIHEPSIRSFLSSPTSWPSPRPIRCLLHISGLSDLRYIDFTAVTAGKRPGVEFCKRIFAHSDEDTLVAGDSGNDFGLFEGQEYGVAPSNSQAELKDWFSAQAKCSKKYESSCRCADAVVEALARLENYQWS